MLPTRDRWHSAIALRCRVLHPLGIHMQHCTGRSVPALTSFSEDASMCSFEIQNAAGRAYVYIYIYVVLGNARVSFRRGSVQASSLDLVTLSESR